MSDLQVNTSTFDVPLAKWIGRKDIRRVFQTEKNSPYVAISLVAEIEQGTVAHVLRETLEAEEPKVIWAVPELPENALPMLKVELVSYGYKSLGTRVLSGIGRYFEKRDIRYYAIDRTPVTVVLQKDGQVEIDADGNDVLEGGELKIVGIWERNGKGEFIGEGQAIPHHNMHGQPLLVEISAQIAEVVKRLNKNQPVADQRRSWWNDINDVTDFGRFKMQAAADRAAKK